MDADRILGDAITEIIGLAVCVAGFETAASGPHGVTGTEVVAAVVGFGDIALDEDGAAEFASPDDDGVFEESALFQVLDQSSRGLVGIEALFFQLGGQVAVLVPAGMHQLYESGAAFDEATGEKAVAGIGSAAVDVRSVHVEDGLGFTGDVGEFWDAGLHAIGHLVLGDAGIDFGITEFIEVLAVDFSDVVEHGPAKRAGHAIGIG